MSFKQARYGSSQQQPILSMTMKRIKASVDRHVKQFGGDPGSIVMGSGSWSVMVKEHPNLLGQSMVKIEVSQELTIQCTMNDGMPKNSILTISKKRHAGMSRSFIDTIPETTFTDIK